ncbi:NAC domain containing protein [Parasponia andersonii]|uniref:NAC domain containing protein n=1 Tax=Parasponia andersonii TaxID=3476 RepID=A0A2P5CJP7_PARAD|nr:NAC domain containing protein [Parasponia andersonii]
MEKLDFLTNGGLKLPIGYRFCPTDEEVLLHYLKKKVHALPLPAVIPEFDVYQTDPWGLPGDVKEKRYFFCNRKKDIVNNNQMHKRVSGSGFWKPISKDKVIVASELNNHAVGVRKTLVFRSGGKRLLQDSNTRWFMHEYHFVRSGTIPINSVHLMNEYYWVVCKVFQKNRRPKIEDSSNRKRMRTEGPSSPSFSGSSGITEVSSQSNGGLELEDHDQEEESSANNISHCSNSCIREPN